MPLHGTLLSGFLRTTPFSISSIPDTARIPFAAHCRSGDKRSFLSDSGSQSGQPRTQNRAMQTPPKAPPIERKSNSIKPSPTRRIPFKLRRPPPKLNLRSPAFDAQLFLDSAGLGRKLAKFRGKETIFAQGDPSNNVMYIQETSVN